MLGTMPYCYLLILPTCVFCFRCTEMQVPSLNVTNLYMNCLLLSTTSQASINFAQHSIANRAPSTMLVLRLTSVSQPPGRIMLLIGRCNRFTCGVGYEDLRTHCFGYHSMTLLRNSLGVPLCMNGVVVLCVYVSKFNFISHIKRYQICQMQSLYQASLCKYQMVRILPIFRTAVVPIQTQKSPYYQLYFSTRGMRLRGVLRILKCCLPWIDLVQLLLNGRGVKDFLGSPAPFAVQRTRRGTVAAAAQLRCCPIYSNADADRHV